MAVLLPPYFGSADKPRRLLSRHLSVSAGPIAVPAGIFLIHSPCMWELKGKRALITGGAERIGKALTLALAKNGVDCLIHYHRSAEKALSLSKEASLLGVSSRTMAADFTDPAGTEAAFRTEAGAFGGLDILVLSASIYEEHSLSQAGAEDYLRHFTVNALAPLSIARAFAEQTAEGVIIAVLDARMVDYDKNHIAYHASKRALFSFLKMMSLEFSPRIRVNGIAPGIILPERGKESESMLQYSEGNPLKRVGTPEEITETLLFLLKNTFITGQVIFVDGGRHLRGSVYGN